MNEKLLTKQIAEQFVAGKIDALDEFTSIDDNAAEALVSFKGDAVSLNGLKSITVEAAKALACFKGSPDMMRASLALSLDGLTSLMDDAAKALASFKGGYLTFNSLKTHH